MTPHDRDDVGGGGGPVTVPSSDPPSVARPEPGGSVLGSGATSLRPLIRVEFLPSEAVGLIALKEGIAAGSENPQLLVLRALARVERAYKIETGDGGLLDDGGAA